MGATLAVVLGTSPAGAHQPHKKAAGEITVLAASSLTEAFTEIEAKFEKKHPNADVLLNFGSSSMLVTQIQQGGPADVIATADEANMEKLVESEHVAASPAVFATNVLEIAVAPDNPTRIASLADTLGDDITLVLCAAEAPCGKYALEAYASAGLTVPTVPTGATAKDTIAKVTLGEADAAVVYVTDVNAADDDVDGVEIPDDENVTATYPISSLAEAVNGPGAKAFVKYVLSKPGQKILRSFGFLEP